jgi:hypothetical protein
VFSPDYFHVHYRFHCSIMRRTCGNLIYVAQPHFKPPIPTGTESTYLTAQPMAERPAVASLEPAQQHLAEGQPMAYA